MSQKTVKTFDFTMKFDDQPFMDIVSCLKGHVSAWAFQLELSEEKNYKHWQGRVRLFHQSRKRQVIEMFSQSILSKAHWSVTSTPSSKTFNYVIKVHTRVEGPWTDKMSNLQDLPRQIKAWAALRPFQQSILDIIMRDAIDDRKINVLFHERGNIGGSQFGIWLQVKGHASFIPPFLDPNDMIQCVMGKPTSRCYYIDMPRGMAKDKLNGFWCGVEMMKNGFIYDKRHSWKEKIMDSPMIWIKTNHMPRIKDMSDDRFVFWTVGASFSLLSLPLEEPHTNAEGRPAPPHLPGTDGLMELSPLLSPLELAG